ncbi:MAG: SPOR domain-containing protein [Pseudomonadales bacterium]|nr:SPOR domain-containing protein [Pseudomonadales bacterium]
MNEHVRNRIVGTVILLSLAAIFVPMLFDGAGIERRRVPELPEPTEDQGARDVIGIDPADAAWDFVEEAARQREAPPEAVLTGEPTHLPEASTADEAPSAGAGLDAAGVPLAWSLQLASFEDEANARALRAQLIEDGYEAYLTTSRVEGRPLHRVAVGPRIERASIERLRTELKDRYDLDGLVVRFTVGASACGDGTP